MIDPAYVEAHADRLRRHNYPRTANAVPYLYAARSPGDARKMVEKLKRLEDAGKPFFAIPGFVDEGNPVIDLSNKVRILLDMYAPLTPAGLYGGKRLPLPEQKKWRPPSKSYWPLPFKRLPHWEAHLIMRMVRTPDLFVLIRTAPQWDKGRMRPAGSAMTDGSNRLRHFNSVHAANRTLEVLERRAFSSPPLCVLSFAECRQRYDPVTRLVRV